jgi:iron transport multicopper oxidase
MRVLLTTLIIFFVFIQVKSHDRHFTAKYKIGWFKASPDGIERQVLGINGKFPEVARIRKGDHVNVEIENLIPNGFTDIHYHGIVQKGTLLSDGVGGVTQCDPLYGQKYTYKFNPGEQTGTYWYHSHSGTQLIDGLRGPFIIDDPEDPFLKPFNYFIDNEYVSTQKNQEEEAIVSKTLFYVDHSKVDDEIDAVILLTDWHHKLADELRDLLLTPGSGGNEPTPDSALINNVGDYLCKTPPCASLYSTKIVAGKAKKFRILNGSAMAVFHFAIQGHKLHIVETDGVTLDGNTVVDTLRLNAGQRYSVIIKADQEPRNYWIRAKMDETIYPDGTVSTNWQPEVYGELKYVKPTGESYSISRPSLESYSAMNAQITKSVKDGAINIDMDVPSCT